MIAGTTVIASDTESKSAIALFIKLLWLQRSRFLSIFLDHVTAIAPSKVDCSTQTAMPTARSGDLRASRGDKEAKALVV
ncbi:MAG: hypothetical protein GVY04_02780 [Cyanobacteria bacterium]|nr:hypothetical protein [Cyanobacteria bacterium GSL.Bin1]